MNQNKTPIYIFSIGFSFFILFSIFLFADFLRKPLPFDLATADGRRLIGLPTVLPIYTPKPTGPEVKKDTIDSSKISHTLHLNDTILIAKANSNVISENLFWTDSTRKRILLFGDSEVETLRLPIYNYCLNNNYNLVASIVWYSSTTFAWAGDTLDYYISKYKPDFVIGVLGLNEIFIKKIEPRRKCIKLIKQKFEDKNISYYLIGPAAWTLDNGIIGLMQEELGTLFYPSQKLSLDRLSDKRHPSFEASKIWFDSVAVKITNHTSFSFANKVLEYKKIVHSPFIVLGLNKTK